MAKTLAEIWPSGLQRLVFTVHLRTDEFAMRELVAACAGFDAFASDERHIWGTVKGVGADEGFHAHVYVSEKSRGGYSVELQIATGEASVDDSVPDLASISKFLRPHIRVEEGTLRGILLASFSFRLDRTVTTVTLPIALPREGFELVSHVGPVIAGIDLAFSDPALSIRRAYIGRHDERNELQVSLMISLAFDPSESLPRRLVREAEQYLRLFVPRDDHQLSLLDVNARSR